MWSEEEMRDIEPEPPAPRTGARSFASALRNDVSRRNLPRVRPAADELTRGKQPGIIFAPILAPAGRGSHGNFLNASYRRILANPAWVRRLEKPHTAKRQAGLTGLDEQTRPWAELDAASSSDALLMNIFCYPRVLHSPLLRALLGAETTVEPEFGVRSTAPLNKDLVNTTEIDMRLGDLLVEAKLTEADFQTASMRLLERFQNLDEVFDRDRLHVTRRGVRSYQLLRGVLAAHAADCRFAVLCDARRPDLAAAWYEIIAAVRSFQLQSRLRLITWQEIASAAPQPLQKFLAEKYGIHSP